MRRAGPGGAGRASLAPSLGALLGALVGFGLTLFVFFPGIMTGDAAAVYGDVQTGVRGDWQSPVMAVVWGWIDPVWPGSGSFLLLSAGVYWAGFGLVARWVAERSRWWAAGVLALALTPPAFVFLGVVYRDVLFGGVWLLAGAVVLAFGQRGGQRDGRLWWVGRLAGVGLVAFGVLLRPNAVAAAPLLVGYALWPGAWRAWRTVGLAVPAAVLLFGLVQGVYYGALGAKRQHPLHSLLVFDLGGISHYSGEVVFPGAWTGEQRRQILEVCYHPTAWDLYWTLDPCQFVMAKLEGEDGVFGTPALVDAWRDAVVRHPLAYVTHRAAFWWTFLTDAELTLGTPDVVDRSASAVRQGVRAWLVAGLVGWLPWTPLSRGGFWLLANAVLCVAAWRRRGTPAGAFGLGVCGAAVVYMGSFAAVGVATDFRYSFFAVVAALAGAGVLAGVGVLARR